MIWTPDAWTPNVLSEVEINKICQWLGSWQAAYVSASSVMEEPIKVDPNIIKAMSHVEALIRHLNGLHKAGLINNNPWEAMPPSQLAGFHDVVFDITGQSPSKSDMFAIWCNLPKEIQEVGDEWGFSDTVFRDRLAKHLRKTHENHTND